MSVLRRIWTHVDGGYVFPTRWPGIGPIPTSTHAPPPARSALNRVNADRVCGACQRSRTGPTAAAVAVAEPAGFVAVTATRKRLLRSLIPSEYVERVAPLRFDQVVPFVERCHW
jgi:hypothetical protein